MGSTRSWLRRFQVRPRKAWGQVFLLNPRIPERMLAHWGLERGTMVIEVGAGAGSLTLPLIGAGMRVAAIERDELLCDLLAQRVAEELPECATSRLSLEDGRDVVFPDPGGLALICGDAAKAAIPPGNRVVVVGNLPYSESSRLLEWVVRWRQRVHWASFMLQKEYGERLLAGPGQEGRSALGVVVRARFEVRRLFDVGPANFWPVPQVHSTVLLMKPSGERFPDAQSEQAFDRVVRGAFAHRRKALGRALETSLGLPRESVTKAMQEAGIPARARAEHCTVDQFATLASLLYPRSGDSVSSNRNSDGV